MDLVRFEVAEIAKASLGDPEEDEQLKLEAERLSDATAYRQAATDAITALEGADVGDRGPDVVGAVGQVDQAMTQLAGRSAFDALRARLETTLLELQDVVSELRIVVEQWEDDPARLIEVQERRHRLAELRRKYGPTLSDVLTYAEGQRARLEELESTEERLGELDRRRREAITELESLEAQLRRARQAAGTTLATSVTPRLRELAMAGATLDVEVQETGAGEPVRFLLAANQGEPARPLAEVASGGELARAMLALRLVTEGGPDTLVFDEVDAGIGGHAALALGRALAELARTPSGAGRHPPAAGRRFRQSPVAVAKQVSDGRTTAVVRPLASEEKGGGAGPNALGTARWHRPGPCRGSLASGRERPSTRSRAATALA